MNYLEFIQTGGFPFDANDLDNMQASYQVFNNLGQLAGDFSIIRGCVITGATISDGIIYINGEVLEFKGGQVEPNVIIIDEPDAEEFENGQVHNVFHKRYATFGIASTSYPWSNFKRAFPTNQIPEALALKEDKATILGLITRLEKLEEKNSVFQNGGAMVFWNKPANQIPNGWREVVDWKGRIPVGFDPLQVEFNAIGKTGGSKTKQLSITEIPSHTHNGHLVQASSNWRSGGDSSGNNATSVPGASGATGGGQAFSILNPYRTVLFIEYHL